jgi:hypothetical protein
MNIVYTSKKQSEWNGCYRKTSSGYRLTGRVAKEMFNLTIGKIALL